MNHDRPLSSHVPLLAWISVPLLLVALFIGISVALGSWDLAVEYLIDRVFTDGFAALFGR